MPPTSRVPFPHPGDGCVPVIAEIGVNHNGDLDTALRLVDAAANAGADAVKLQIFSPETLTTALAPTARYQRDAATQRELLTSLTLSIDALHTIRKHCAARNVAFLATPFSPTDVDTLAELEPSAVKIASTDVDNTLLIAAACELYRPLIVSTGAALEREVEVGVDTLQSRAAFARTTLLHCVSAYPTPTEHLNLRRMAALAQKFDAPVGFSDHSTSEAAGAWAVLAGAVLLEKHITLDRTAAGPDHAASLDPDAFARYVANVRAVTQALGDGAIPFQPIEADVRSVSRKSLVCTRALEPGEVIALADLAAKRPPGGLPPSACHAVAGRRVRRAVERDTPLTADLLA